MVSNDLIAPEFYNITEELEKFSQDSDRQAIRWLNTQQERRTVSYLELNQKMNQYANAFTEKGLQKGDRVLVIIPRLPEAYFVFLGRLKAGIVPISCSEMLRASDLEYRMEHSSASAVIAYEAFTSEVDQIASSVDALKNKLVIGAAKGDWTSLDELASVTSQLHLQP